MLLRIWLSNIGNADVLPHALLEVSAIRGKTGSHLINRIFCEENNIVLNQKLDEEQFSDLKEVLFGKYAQ